MRKTIDLSHILLIDDDMSTNYFNEMIIQQLGYDLTVDILPNGMDALSYLVAFSQKSSEHAGLILLDLNMPQLNAWDFLAQYNGLPAKIKNKFKIFILSSSTYSDDMDFAMNHIDVVGYLHKPLSLPQLQDLIKEHYEQ